MKFGLSLGMAAAICAVSIFSGTVEARVRHHTHLAMNYKSHGAHKFHKRHLAMRRPASSDATRERVISLIKGSAPSYGVPTWFALRIAKVESNYNPNIRGAAGEYGVFQLKCATAKSVGFRGNCSALLNPATNVRFGLQHLSLAVRMSHGNLRMAASKHNGGLGRKSLVRNYVAMVF